MGVQEGNALSCWANSQSDVVEKDEYLHADQKNLVLDDEGTQFVYVLVDVLLELDLEQILNLILVKLDQEIQVGVLNDVKTLEVCLSEVLEKME